MKIFYHSRPNKYSLTFSYYSSINLLLYYSIQFFVCISRSTYYYIMIFKFYLIRNHRQIFTVGIKFIHSIGYDGGIYHGVSRNISIEKESETYIDYSRF